MLLTHMRKLYEQDLDAHRADFASYLKQYGITVTAHVAGRWDEACEAERIAVVMQRALAGLDPAAQRPELAS